MAHRYHDKRYAQVLHIIHSLSLPISADDIGRIRDLADEGIRAGDILFATLRPEQMCETQDWLNYLDLVHADDWAKYAEESLDNTEAQAEQKMVEEKLSKEIGNLRGENVALRKEVKKANKRYDEISAMYDELVELLMNTNSQQGSGMDTTEAARLETLLRNLDDVIVQLNDLHTESNSNTTLRGGMGGQLEDEEHRITIGTNHRLLIAVRSRNASVTNRTNASASSRTRSRSWKRRSGNVKSRRTLSSTPLVLGSSETQSLLKQRRQRRTSSTDNRLDRCS
jgi:hypothetical protein